MDDEQKTIRVQLMMSPSEVLAIDDWSFGNRVRARAEAIRRLIELGLAADPAPAGKGKAAQQSSPRK